MAETDPIFRSEWFDALYTCTDPDCTATHVDLDKIRDVGFGEFPRVAISEPASVWRAGGPSPSRDEMESQIQEQIQGWVTRMVLIDNARYELLMITMLARNPWWLHLIAKTQRWQEVARG